MPPRSLDQSRLRVRFAWGLLLLAGFATDPVSRARCAERPPNIVLIVADDLGYGALGCYGQTIVPTPHLDRLAAKGIRFTEAYAGCAECAPSRSVLMTGKHTGHGRVRKNSQTAFLRPEDQTVAELLQSAGYRTGLFGKWGLGDIDTPGAPDRQGFDTFFGYLDQVHAHYYYPDYLWDNRTRLELPGNRNGGRAQYSHDLLEERAHAFIRENRERPFFAYVPYTIPHAELLVPDDSMKPFVGKFPETPFIDTHYASQPTPKAAYAGMITRLDRSVGRLLDLLAELRIEGQTIVIFTSDNGPTLAGGSDPAYFRNAGPLRGLKFSLYEGGVRVPMIVAGTERVPPGRVSDFAWGFQDILPTFCELAGVAIPAGLDGVSVVPTLAGRSRDQTPHPGFYWEEPGRAGLMQAVRVGSWKLVKPGSDAPTELYDLGADPSESTDLSLKEPERRASLERFLAASRTPPDE